MAGKYERPRGRPVFSRNRRNPTQLPAAASRGASSILAPSSRVTATIRSTSSSPVRQLLMAGRKYPGAQCAIQLVQGRLGVSSGPEAEADHVEADGRQQLEVGRRLHLVP